MIFIWAFVVALLPASLGLFALVWRKRPPADIGIYGYRTKLSMQSKESWGYAHKLCAKLFPRYNLTTLIASEIALFAGYAISKDNVMIVAICLLVIQIVLILLLCAQIDKALKENTQVSITDSVKTAEDSSEAKTPEESLAVPRSFTITERQLRWIQLLARWNKFQGRIPDNNSAVVRDAVDLYIENYDGEDFSRCLKDQPEDF